MRNYRYIDIHKLFFYCKTIGVYAEISPLFDGWKITFKNGSDVIQHRYSYGSVYGCVEFAIGSRADYRPTSLKNAKAIVRRHKEKLNGELKGGAE